MSVSGDTLQMLNNEALSRFEARIHGTLAGVCEYRIVDDSMIFPHTETMPAYRGRGIAARLVEFALNDAKARGLSIVSRCSFVDEYLAGHPEFTA